MSSLHSRCSHHLVIDDDRPAATATFFLAPRCPVAEKPRRQPGALRESENSTSPQPEDGSPPHLKTWRPTASEALGCTFSDGGVTE